jgi:septation ring formation regulator EzrA
MNRDQNDIQRIVDLEDEVDGWTEDMMILYNTVTVEIRKVEQAITALVEAQRNLRAVLRSLEDAG